VNREVILEQLMQAERNIGTGECESTRLRQDLARLERAGDTTDDARQALQTCEQLQALHRAERTRLLAELSTSRQPQG
jgi:Tfp pilus assembly protein PilN